MFDLAQFDMIQWDGEVVTAVTVNASASDRSRYGATVSDELYYESVVSDESE